MAGVPMSCFLIMASVICTSLLSGVMARSRRPSGTRDTQLAFHALWLRNCKDANPLVTFDNMIVRPSPNGGNLVDTNFTIGKTARFLRLVQVKINRCRERVSPGTCEYYGTFSWRTNICGLMAQPNMMWTPLIQSVSPQMKCPLKEGHYVSTNASWDVNSPLARQVPVEGFIWTGTTTARDHEDALWMCVQGALKATKPGN